MVKRSYFSDGLSGGNPESGRDFFVDALTSISDAQAESFSKTPALFLGGLTSITDLQAKNLSRVEQLKISEALQPLIDKYKNQ